MTAKSSDADMSPAPKRASRSASKNEESVRSTAGKNKFLVSFKAFSMIILGVL